MIHHNSSFQIVLRAFLLPALAAAMVVWPAAAQGQDEAVEHAKNLSRAFRRAAEAIVPTVVKITTHTNPEPQTGRTRRGNPFRGTPFEDYFSDDLEMFQQRPVPRDGVGSGVIIDRGGIVLTNNHVVEGADEVVVRLNDGREFKTTDIKTDKETDLAVLRIEGAGELPAARLGDSDQLDVGDWVLAVGNPFQLETTVSAGIISGKGRSLGNVRRSKFLQTDAAINPGNSGGPLVNLDGEVIGINTAIATVSGGYQGIGFAIPINTARWVTDQLIKSGKVQRAYLGVGIQEVTNEVAEKFKLPRARGVLVSEVMPGAPADEAGVRDGDVIVQFAGKQVEGPRELQEMVERSKLGSQQPLVVMRDGEQVRLQVKLEALPDRIASSTTRKLGFEIDEMTDEAAQRLKLRRGGGVLVTKVDRQGLAYAKGLREGMAILRIGKQPIDSVETFDALLEQESLEDGIMLMVRTPEGNQFIVLEEGNRER
jgi:serine protease Do